MKKAFSDLRQLLIKGFENHCLSFMKLSFLYVGYYCTSLHEQNAIHQLWISTSLSLSSLFCVRSYTVSSIQSQSE